MEKDRGVERLVAFSDAVVAIAITLVVLPLVDTARDGEYASVEAFFRENGGAVAAGALSFVVIANLWQVHHTVFGRFDGMTRGMMRANLLWLAAIAFLPLPTVLLVETSRGDQLGTVLYIGTMLVATMSMSAIGEIATGVGSTAERNSAARRGDAGIGGCRAYSWRSPSCSPHSSRDRRLRPPRAARLHPRGVGVEGAGLIRTGRCRFL